MNKKYRIRLFILLLTFFSGLFSSCLEPTVNHKYIYLDGNGGNSETTKESGPYVLECYGYDNYLEIPYIKEGSGYTTLNIEWYWYSPTGTLATVQMVSDEYGKMASTTIWHGMQGECYTSSGACLAGATYTDWSSGGVEADCADSASKLQFFIQDGNNNWEAVYGTIYIQKIWLSGYDRKDMVLYSSDSNYQAIELSMSLSYSTYINKPIKDDITIYISTSKSNISRIGYVYTIDDRVPYDAYSILYNTSFVSAKEYDKRMYRIEAPYNGFYWIAAQDSDGFMIYIVKEITNIDKTPPSPVTNLHAEYDESEKEITITWTNPSDSDFSYAELSCTENGATRLSGIHIAGGRYVLRNKESDDVEYVFNVCAVDNVGNRSDYSTTRISVEKKLPVFTSFNIPLVSVANKGNTVTATVIGEHFNSNLDFNYSWSGDLGYPLLSVINDSLIHITFTIPAVIGDYPITVSCEDLSITGTLMVGDYSSYSVGDVLLNDGTIIPYDADNLSFTDEEKQKSVGILYGFNEYGAPAGYLGIYNSAGGTNSGVYQWATDNTTGFNTSFTGIVCTPSIYCDDCDDSAATATFTGDTDGSDNWAYIRSIDPSGTVNTAVNYPAFNYVNNYAETFGLTGDYATGWYMPSIAELCYIYRNQAILNSVLYALGGVELYSGNYWSSSQENIGDVEDVGAWGIALNEGSICNWIKYGDIFVCTVRSFKEIDDTRYAIRYWTPESTATAWSVYNYEDLEKLAEIVNGGNNLTGVTITQKKNIAINDSESVLRDNFIEPEEAAEGEPNASLNVFAGIGNRRIPFSGTYDGNGKKISGMYIYANHQGLGFFGCIKNATIKNVIIVDSCVVNNNESGQDDGSDDDRFGGLIGTTFYSSIDNETNINTIENCIFVGAVGSKAAKDRGGAYEYIGGIIGRVESGSTANLQNCYSLVRLYGSAAALVNRVSGTLNCTDCIGVSLDGNVYRTKDADDAALDAVGGVSKSEIITAVKTTCGIDLTEYFVKAGL